MPEIVQFLQDVADTLGCHYYTADTLDGRWVCGLENGTGRDIKWEIKAYGKNQTHAEDNLNALLHDAGYYRDRV